MSIDNILEKSIEKNKGVLEKLSKAQICPICLEKGWIVVE